METGKVARVKKKAQREGRLIVFVDESGLSTKPTRVRTWAPRGRLRCFRKPSTGRASRSSVAWSSCASFSKFIPAASRDL